MAPPLTRRALCAALVGAAALRPRPVQAVTGRRVQTVLDLVPPDPRATEALINDHTTPLDWARPGNAASASIRTAYWQLGLAPIVWARWLLIWNPNGQAANGAQLSHVGFNYTDEQVVSQLTDRVETTPIALAVDVTATVRALQAAGEQRFWLHKLRGQPIVFASTLELVWDLDG